MHVFLVNCKLSDEFSFDLAKIVYINEKLNWCSEKNNVIDKTQNEFKRGSMENLTQINNIKLYV